MATAPDRLQSPIGYGQHIPSVVVTGPKHIFLVDANVYSILNAHWEGFSLDVSSLVPSDLCPYIMQVGGPA